MCGAKGEGRQEGFGGQHVDASGLHLAFSMMWLAMKPLAPVTQTVLGTEAAILQSQVFIQAGSSSSGLAGGPD